MSGMTPPSEYDDFSELLNRQAREGQQRHRTNSSESNPYYTYDEPRQLHSRGSMSSLNRQNSLNRSSSLHQDSYPLDNQPTIFATSPMPGSAASSNPFPQQNHQTYDSFSAQNQGDYVNGQQGQQSTDQFWTNYIQDDGQQLQQPPQIQQPDQQAFNQANYHQYDQAPLDQNNGASTSYNPAWSQQFVQQQQQQQQNGVDYSVSQNDSVGGGGGWSGINGMSGSMDATGNDSALQEELAEL